MTQGSEKRSNTAVGAATRVGTVVVFMALPAALLFGGAIMLRTGPETIAERGRVMGMWGRDKVKVRYRLVPGIW